MMRRLLTDRLEHRGQGGFALMAGLAIWVGVSGVTMVALLNMTMTSSRIASTQAATAAQFRAIDAAMETAVTQVIGDPDALIGAATGLDDESCVEPIGAEGSDGLHYRDDHGILVTVTARCLDDAGSSGRIADIDMAAEQPGPTVPTPAPNESSAPDDAAGLAVKQSVRTVVLDAVMTLPDGSMRAAGTARIRVSDVRGNGSAVVIDDWSVTPERPYVPPTTTTTTVKPTTTTTVKPTTTTSTTTTVKPTTTTTTVEPTTTVPSAPSAATWTMRITSDWNDGYCAEVTVTNPTSSTLTWIVDTPIEGRISSFWNGEYTRSGDTLRVRGADWNRTINAWGTTGFGFCSTR